MSEKRIHNPEADTLTLIDLYQQAADYLETDIHTGKAKKVPALYEQFGMLKVTTEVPEMNGKRIVLGYERPATDEDPTQIDLDIPLAWTDETGLNHWQTPINITAYEGDEVLHEYILEWAGEEDWTRVCDRKLQPGQEVSEYDGMTRLDANELMAHMEWALEQRSS